MNVTWHPKQELESLGGSKPKAPKRADRVAEAIRNELTVLLLQKVRDPELQDVVISRVAVSDDLRHAKIYYRLRSGKVDRKRAEKRLIKATGFMRSHLARTINLRFTPDLRFWYDDGAEQAEEMEHLLAELARKRNERENGS